MTDEQTVLVAWPDDGTTTGEFTASITQLITVSSLNRVTRGFVRLPTGPILDQARNDIVDRFMGSDADWLLQIDSDMQFTPDLIDRLFVHADPEKVPVIGALCFSEGHDGPYPTIYQEQAGRFAQLANPPLNKLVRVAGTGTGCLMVHRSVFERIAEANLGRPFDRMQIGGVATGEDLAFMARCGSLEIPVHVDTSIEVGHVKPRVLGFEEFYRWRRDHRFIVTGTGRCGTRYMAMLFNIHQVACGHELVYSPEFETTADAWWTVRGDSSWLAAPHLEGFDGPIFHLMRNPLDVLNSFIGIGFFEDGQIGSPYHDYARRHLPEAFITDDPIERATSFIIGWNSMIADHAHYQIRVEELTAEFFFQVLNDVGTRTNLPYVQRQFPVIPTNLNTAARAELGWDDVPDRLRVHAKVLGYDV